MILEKSKYFSNIKLDVGVYETPLLDDKIFNPFVAKNNSPYPLEIQAENLVEWAEQTFILDAEAADYEVNFGAIDKIKCLIIRAEVVDYWQSVQPDFELSFTEPLSDGRYTHKVREIYISQFHGTDEVAIWISNPLVYDLKIKIITISGD